MTLGKFIQLPILLLTLISLTSCNNKGPDISKVRELSSVTVEEPAQESETMVAQRVSSRSSDSEVLHGLGLLDYEKVAKQIFLVKKAMSEEFPVGDGLTFTMYILRYLAEVGDYTLTHEDISNLLVAFEKISGEKLDEVIYETVSQIKSLKFSKKDGNYSVTIFSMDKKKGILIPINELSDEGMVEEIKYALIENKAEISFSDVNSKSKMKALKRFLTEKITIPLISETLLPPLNQLHKDIEFDIENYLDTSKIIPLEIKVDGIFIRVNTTTIFNNINFYLRTLYTLPGRKKGDSSIPSLVMRIRAKLLSVKLSIDQ